MYFVPGAAASVVWDLCFEWSLLQALNATTDNASARPKNYRVLYHDEVCGECKRAEYACICDDAGGAEHKH